MISPKDVFSVTITTETLDAAIASWDDMSLQRHAICEQCVVARAVQEVLGKEAWVADHAMAKGPINHYVHEWQGDYVAQRLVNLFDAAQYDEIREMLPVTVKFTPHTYLLEK